MSQDVTSAVNTGSISQSSAAVTIGSTYPPLMSQTGLRYSIIYYLLRHSMVTKVVSRARLHPAREGSSLVTLVERS